MSETNHSVAAEVTTQPREQWYEELSSCRLHGQTFLCKEFVRFASLRYHYISSLEAG